MTVDFERGEEIRTEISCKFTRAALTREYAAAGLRLASWHTDGEGLFALSLLAPAPEIESGFRRVDSRTDLSRPRAHRAGGRVRRSGPSAACAPDRPYVVACMIVSADGHATIDGGTARLSSETDRALFLELRTQVDAVMAGTRTIAVERYGPLVQNAERRERRLLRGLDPVPPAVTPIGRWNCPPRRRCSRTRTHVSSSSPIRMRSPRGRRATPGRAAGRRRPRPRRRDAPASCRSRREGGGAGGRAHTARLHASSAGRRRALRDIRAAGRRQRRRTSARRRRGASGPGVPRDDIHLTRRQLPVRALPDPVSVYRHWARQARSVRARPEQLLGVRIVGGILAVVGEGDDPVGGDDERPRSLSHVTHRLARQRAVSRRPKEALRKLRADVLLPVLAQARPRDSPPARGRRGNRTARRACGRSGTSGRRGTGTRRRRPLPPEEVFVVPAQLDEVLAAERSAEMAHERHHEWLLAPALRQVNLAFPRLEREVREGVAG